MIRVAAILILMSLAAQACASSAADPDFAQRGQHLRQDDEPWALAWMAARARLEAMCADPTTSCADKMIRASTSVRFDEWLPDDWEPIRLPSYRTVVAVQEEELRKRHVPRVYEVYMLGVSYYLADKADRGEITQSQLVRAFNAAWKEMVNRTRADVAFTGSAVEAARADTETWARFRDAASTIGSALSAVFGDAAAAGSNAPTPVVKPSRQVTCQATPNIVTGQSEEMTVRCQ
jgi:hypothetical protein